MQKWTKRDWKKLAIATGTSMLIGMGALAVAELHSSAGHKDVSDPDKDGIPMWMEKECPSDIFGTNQKSCPDPNSMDMYFAIYYMKDKDNNLKMDDVLKHMITERFSGMGIKAHLVDDGNPAGGPIGFSYSTPIKEIKILGKWQNISDSNGGVYSLAAKEQLRSMFGSYDGILPQKQRGIFYHTFIINNIDNNLKHLGYADDESTGYMSYISHSGTKHYNSTDNTFVHEGLHLILGHRIPEGCAFVKSDGTIDYAHTKWANDILYPYNNSVEKMVRNETLSLIKELGTAKKPPITR